MMPWYKQAACRGLTELMTDPSRSWKAKKVCKRCPVLEDCRDYVIAHPEPWGVWGGMSLEERERPILLNPTSVDLSFEEELFLSYDRHMLELRYTVEF